MPSRQIPGPKGGTLRPNQPGERRGGRQAGTPNKATRALRELILLAAESVGRPKIVRNRRGDIIRLEETGKDGALGYLRYLALHEPRTFGGLLGRVLPLQVAARLDGGVDVNQRLTPGRCSARWRGGCQPTPDPGRGARGVAPSRPAGAHFRG
jgi:hypothetical protein